MSQHNSKGWVKTCPNCKEKVDELSRICPACSYDWDRPVITIKRQRNTLALLCKFYCLAMLVALPVALLGAVLKFDGSVMLKLLTPFYWVLGTLAVCSPIIFPIGLVGLFKSKEFSEKAFCLFAIAICVGAVVVTLFFANGLGSMR
jgi:hypothetical protein